MKVKIITIVFIIFTYFFAQDSLSIEMTPISSQSNDTKSLRIAKFIYNHFSEKQNNIAKFEWRVFLLDQGIPVTKREDEIVALANNLEKNTKLLATTEQEMERNK